MDSRSDETTSSHHQNTAPSALTVAIGEQSAVFRQVTPRSLGIRYPAYYMLETEVTNAQYREYLIATGKTKDDTEVLTIVEERKSGKRSVTTGSVVYSVGDQTGLWRKGQYPTGRGDHPLALVTLGEAHEFCKWLSKQHPELGLFRLPTWNEWMVAAYGRERNYPWGDEWETDRVHMSYGIADEFKNSEGKLVWRRQKPQRTEAVKARPQGRTPEGLYGMLGNVSEYIIEGDPNDKQYFNLGSRWMGGDYSSGWNWSPREDTDLPPRKDYWGYGHHTVNRKAGLGFRVLLDVTADPSLVQKKRLFVQNDTSWMLEAEDD